MAAKVSDPHQNTPVSAAGRPRAGMAAQSDLRYMNCHTKTVCCDVAFPVRFRNAAHHPPYRPAFPVRPLSGPAVRLPARSEEHTSELQSRPHLVCRLLLEKKKTNC